MFELKIKNYSKCYSFSISKASILFFFSDKYYDIFVTQHQYWNE